MAFHGVILLLMEPTSQSEPTIFRLRSVTERLKYILLESTKKSFWVRAQLVSEKGARKAGHFYGELVDVGDGGETVAKMRAVIWRAEYEKIRRKLIDAGQPETLQGNREICALCSLRFHEVYGLQLQILDVDPNFGESHINRNRREILERLQKDGMLDKNKATVLAAAPLRIGLITSANSAACADFTATLGASPFSFSVSLISTTMQGPRTAGEVIAAIKTLVRSQVDVICIVRGGGSPVDLAWFDNEAIGRTIGDSPVPVWVGVGHEIDLTVPDLVAHTHFKTPTAVAEALVERIRTLDNDLHLSRDRLLEIFSRRMDLAQRSMEQDQNGLRQGVRKHLEIYSERFLSRLVKLESGLDAMVSGHAARLSEGLVQLQERVRARLGIKDQSVENARFRFEKSVMRRLQDAEKANAQNAHGLVEGARKHLAWSEERFRHCAISLQNSIDNAFSHRLGLLTTKVALLNDRLRGCRDDGERALLDRKNELLAVFDRLVHVRRNTLELKTSRFGLALYDRILDQTVQNLEEKRKRLSALSPEQLLARGYSITRDQAGRIVRSVDDVQPGETIRTQLASGSLFSEVTKKENNADE
jgi:exodeoxyribonuclease VII large subunit